MSLLTSVKRKSTAWWRSCQRSPLQDNRCPCTPGFCCHFDGKYWCVLCVPCVPCSPGDCCHFDSKYWFWGQAHVHQVILDDRYWYEARRPWTPGHCSCRCWYIIMDIRPGPCVCCSHQWSGTNNQDRLQRPILLKWGVCVLYYYITLPFLTEIGKAYLRAMAAKNISMQIRKFW